MRFNDLIKRPKARNGILFLLVIFLITIAMFRTLTSGDLKLDKENGRHPKSLTTKIFHNRNNKGHDLKSDAESIRELIKKFDMETAMERCGDFMSKYGNNRDYDRYIKNSCHLNRMNFYCYHINIWPKEDCEKEFDRIISDILAHIEEIESRSRNDLENPELNINMKQIIRN